MLSERTTAHPWIDAFSDLQDAITMAQAGDEIRVAQGIYTPTQDPLDREATFQLKDGVTITGGYAGDVCPHNYSDGVGGGLSCWGSSPQLTDCAFADNYAAVYVSSDSYPVFTGCIWEDNHARGGGSYLCES